MGSEGGTAREEGPVDRTAQVDVELSRVLISLKLLSKALCRAQRGPTQKVLDISQD